MLRATATALGLFALVAGCWEAPEDKLIGTWILDAESFRTLDEFQELSEEEREFALELLRMMTMELTFTREHVRFVAVVMGETKTEEASYRVASATGDTIVLVTRDSKDRIERVTAELRGAVLVIRMGGKQTLTLKKK